MTDQGTSMLTVDVVGPPTVRIEKLIDLAVGDLNAGRRVLFVSASTAVQDEAYEELENAMPRRAVDRVRRSSGTITVSLLNGAVILFVAVDSASHGFHADTVILDGVDQESYVSAAIPCLVLSSRACLVRARGK